MYSYSRVVLIHGGEIMRRNLLGGMIFGNGGRDGALDLGMEG